MRLTKENENVTIHQDKQEAIVREINTMTGMNITKKTSVNLRHLLPDYNPETMVQSVKFSVGQTIHMVEPHGQGVIQEIRLNNERDVGNYAVELLIRHDNGSQYIINYSDVV